MTPDSVAGSSLDSNSETSIKPGVEEILERLALPEGNPEQLVILPDATYPFHPTTGMVTAPELVGAVASAFPDATVTVGITGSEHASGSRTADYLGYTTLAEQEGLTIAYLDDTERVRTRTDDGRVVPLPEPFVDATVINVPTLRYGEESRLAGGMMNLARVVGTVSTNGIVAATEVIDPAFTLLDGTYTFTGRPQASRFLLGAMDTPHLDRVAAWLLECDDDEISYLSGGTTSGPYTAEGVDLAAVRSGLPNGDRPTASTPGPAMRLGYKLYTTVANDAYPPQFIKNE